MLTFPPLFQVCKEEALQTVNLFPKVEVKHLERLDVGSWKLQLLTLTGMQSSSRVFEL